MIINVWFINGGYYRVLPNASTPVNYYHVKSSILEQNFIRFKWAAVILLKIHSTFSTPSSFLHIGVLLMLAQFDLRLCCFVWGLKWAGHVEKGKGCQNIYMHQWTSRDNLLKNLLQVVKPQPCSPVSVRLSIIEPLKANY